RKTDPENKTSPKYYENKIYIFDMKTYSWIKSFDTSNITSQGNPTNIYGDSKNKNEDASM
ncbi:892_t:CDS:1, partial [Racocetra fulgida]